MSIPKHYWEVAAKLDVHYEIRECVGLLDPENPDLAELADGHSPGGCRLVVIDHNVARIHGDRITGYFRERGVDIRVLELPGGEQNKTLPNALRVVTALNDIGTFRSTCPPVAIGGGVVLDVVGLAAALYRRGIPYVRVPTTLLALVDVSAAAKNGVNFEGYRNRVGSYAAPPITLVDRSFVATTSFRQISNGAGEIYKLGVAKDAELFELLEAEGSRLVRDKFQGSPGADEVIRRSITGMVGELRDNLWERDLRRVVDYGHSFSPMVEMKYVSELLHGEAVVLDCIFSAVLAYGRNHLDLADVHRIIAAASSLGLPLWHKGFGDPALLFRALDDTVRHRNGQQNLPVMTAIGEVDFLGDVTLDEIAWAAWQMESLSSCHARVAPVGEVDA